MKNKKEQEEDEIDEEEINTRDTEICLNYNHKRDKSKED